MTSTNYLVKHTVIVCLSVIDDINYDGVNEVFLAHGGDPDFPPENKTRYPGRLLLVDGADGQLIGSYINMPDGLETYNSPVLHKDKQGVSYLLIGTGGETVPGKSYYYCYYYYFYYY